MRRGKRDPIRESGNKERSWPTLCNVLAGPSRSLCLQPNFTHTHDPVSGCWYMDTRGKIHEVRGSGLSCHSPSPHVLHSERCARPACGGGRQFQFLLGGWLVLPIVGVGQPLWKETLFPNPSLEHCLPLLVAEPRGKARSGSKMAGPVGTFPEGLLRP